MTTFTVEWTVEVEATTPEDAARHTLVLMAGCARENAGRFDVYCDDPDEGDGYHHHIVAIEGADEPQRVKAPRPVTRSDWQTELEREFPDEIAKVAGLA